MTLDDFDSFVQKLNAHDWFYGMSDDPNVHAAGRNSFNELSRIAKTSPEAVQVFRAFRKYYAYQQYPALAKPVSAQELDAVVELARSVVAEQQDQPA